MYKIINLKINNIKGLKAVDITPAGNIVMLTGKNGAGKTSVIDAIMYALGGKGAHEEKPVRAGEAFGSIRIDLGDMLVIQTIEADGKSKLIVENKRDNSIYKSPQALLDGFVGKLSFDPLKFIEATHAEQAKTLKGLLGIETQWDELEAQRKAAYDERTAINRDVKRLKAQTDSIQLPAACPEAAVDISALQMELNDAHQKNDYTNLMEQKSLEYQDKMVICDQRIEQLKQEIAALEIKKSMLTSSLKAITDTKIARIDMAAINQRISHALEQNKLVAKYQEKQRFQGELGDAELQSQSMTDEITRTEIAKGELIKSAKMPIAGLALTDAGVDFNGIPIKQLSQAEKWRIGLAIGMALNPGLRVMSVKDGSLLDADSMTAVAKMAEEKDFQVWVEAVANEAGVGFYIEEGEIKTRN